MSVAAPSSVTYTSPCWNGLIVPGSTLMYGSSFIIVTRRPRASRMAAREAAAMPLPREDTTPPVTKTSGVTEPGEVMGSKGRWKSAFYRFDAARSEERRVGKECVRTGRSRWSPNHKKKNKEKK